MIKLVNSIVAISFFMISTATMASDCWTPVKIEIYDQGSSHFAHLLKNQIKADSLAKVKIENIVRDQYDRPKRDLPYVYAKPTLHFNKKTDHACVEIAVRSLTQMGIDLKDISYRPYAFGKELNVVRVSIPPRTFLYP